MKSLLYFIYIYFIDLVAKIYYRIQDGSNKSYDLIIVKTDLIGDMVLFFPFLETIKEKYKNKKILIICSNQNTDLLRMQFSEFDLIDMNIKVMHTKKRFFQIQPLLSVSANELVYPVYSREFFFGDSLVKLIKAKSKIGFHGEHSNISKSIKYLCDFNYSILYQLDAKNKMEIDRNLEIAEMFFKTKIDFKLPQIAHNEPTKQNIAIVAIGGSWRGKKWPIDRFINLAKFIKEETDLDPVFCGTNTDVNQKELLEINQTVFENLIGRTNIMELLNNIARSKLVICNDSSTLHFASALGIPVLSFVGGGHFGRFAPWTNANKIQQHVLNFEMNCYNCLWYCPYVENKDQLLPCIDKISINTAKEKITSLKNEGLFK